MKLLVLCLTLVATTLGALPNYIPKCSRAEPDIGRCFVEQANKAIETLVLGDQEFHIPAMKPALQHPGLKYKLDDEFYFQMKDTIVSGIDSIQLTDAKINFEESTIFFQFHFVEVEWNGTYVARALKANDEVTDKANIVYQNNEFQLTMKYTIENNHMVVQNISVIYIRTPNIDFHFINMDKHPEIEALWNRTRDDFIRSGKGALEKLITAIFSAIFKVATFDEIFPPK